MANSRRVLRIDAEIQKSLAKIISKMDDTLITNSMVSIMKVETFADLSLSKIYISTLGGLENKQKVVEKLNSIKKEIRYELAHEMKFRSVPDLLFIVDDVTERAEKVLKLFEKIESQDNKN